MAKNFGTIDAVLSDATKKRCQQLMSQHKPLPGRINPYRAAVLVPLCTTTECSEPSILFTVRTKHVRRNPGDVCFPGGGMNESETAIETALREANEEIGLNSSQVDVWGTLPTVTTHDRKFSVVPVLCNCGNLDVATLYANRQQDEVDAVFAKSISELCDPKHHETMHYGAFALPIYSFEDMPKIWGLTAFILHQTLRLLVPKSYSNPQISLPSWFGSKI